MGTKSLSTFINLKPSKMISHNRRFLQRGTPILQETTFPEAMISHVLDGLK